MSDAGFVHAHRGDAGQTAPMTLRYRPAIGQLAAGIAGLGWFFSGPTLAYVHGTMGRTLHILICVVIMGLAERYAVVRRTEIVTGERRISTALLLFGFWKLRVAQLAYEDVLSVELVRRGSASSMKLRLKSGKKVVVDGGRPMEVEAAYNALRLELE